MASDDEGDDEDAQPTFSYHGRRLFQGVIAAIGIIVLLLGVRDLAVGEGAQPLDPGLQQSQPIEDFNRFLDEGIGRRNIDFFMLAIGAWIAFFGLDGVLCRGPQLSFGPDGLRYFRFGRQVLPWSAFNHVNFVQRRRTSLLRSSYIDLQLHDPAPYAAGQPFLYRAFRRLMHPFDGSVFTIYGYDIEAPLVSIIQRMQEIAEPESVRDEEDGTL